MKCKFKNLAMLLAVLLLVASCQIKDQFDDIKMEGDSPAFVLPLIKSTITFKELAEKDKSNTLVFDDATGEYYLSFIDTLRFGSQGVGGSVMNQISDRLEFKFQGAPEYVEDGKFIWKARYEGYDATKYNLKRIYPETCVIDIEINSDKKVECMMNVMSVQGFDNAKFDELHGKHIRQYGHTPTIIEVAVGAKKDCNGYIVFDPEDKNEHDWFYICFSDLKIDDQLVTQADVVLNNITLNATISGLVKDSVEGKFSLATLDVPETVDLKVDVFQSTLEADIYIENPQLRFTVNNGAVALDFLIDNIKAYRSYTYGGKGEENSLIIANQGTPGNNDLEIGVWNSTIRGENKFILTGENSNINDAFKLAPTNIKFDAKLKGQSGGVDLSTVEDFVVSATTGVNVELQTEIMLPLHGYANFLLKDGVELPLPTLPEIEINNYGMDSAKVLFFLHANNGMPIDVELQAYFVDTTGLVVDSLLIKREDCFVKAAEVDANGFSQGKRLTKREIDIDIERYKKIQKATKVIVQAEFHTTDGVRNNPNPPLVRVMSKDELDVWIGVELHPHYGRKKTKTTTN